MVSKLEALQRGDIVTIDGQKVFLDKKRKAFILETGESIDVSGDRDIFPQSEADVRKTKEKRKLKKEIKSFPLGETAGQLAYDVGQKASLTSGPLDWVNRLTNTADNYLAKQQAQRSVSEEISEDRPILSALGTAGGIGVDLFGTKGMSATKAAPALTLAGAGSRVIDEPMEVAGETALSGALGFALDKGGQFLSNVAKRRGLSREIASEAPQVEARNIAGHMAVEAENLAAKSKYQKDLLARENKAIQAKNKYEQAKAIGSKEEERLLKEYKDAQAAYKKELKDLPRKQAEEQAKVSARNQRYYDTVSQKLPRDSRVSVERLGTQEFLTEELERSALGATPSGKEASRIIKRLFPEGEELTGKMLSKRLKELDKVIETLPRETQLILDSFKRNLGRKLSEEISLAIIQKESLPLVTNRINKDVKSAFRNVNLDPALGLSNKQAISEVNLNISKALNEMSPADFANKMKSGSLVDELVEKAIPKDRFYVPRESIKIGNQPIPEAMYEKIFSGMEQNYNKLRNNLTNQLEQTIQRAESKSAEKALNARRSVSRQFRETYGIAEPLPSPTQPSPPVAQGAPLPPPVQPKPAPPTPQVFNPEPVPQLPPAQGITERTGDFLENTTLGSLTKGGYKSPIAQLGVLKYLGLPMPSTAAAAGAFGALKGLTSPGFGGEVARASFKAAGLGAIDQWAQRYPSYHDGILDSPIERRSLVKEIEDDPSIPLEVKALTQSQVNRGKPLSEAQSSDLRR